MRGACVCECSAREGLKIVLQIMFLILLRIAQDMALGVPPVLMNGRLLWFLLHSGELGRDSDLTDPTCAARMQCATLAGASRATFIQELAPVGTRRSQRLPIRREQASNP